MEVRVLTESQIRGLVDRSAAFEAVRGAFVALDGGKAILPPPIELEIPANNGDIHVKGAYLAGDDYFAFKAASGFYDNPRFGLPVTGGLSIAFDARTGLLAGLLFDNGWLTEVRTGAAGALAADLLAVQRPEQVGIIGVGGQARHQLEALLQVRQPMRVVAYGRTRDRALAFQRDIKERCGFEVDLASTARDAVEHSQIVITTTPAREPIVMADWVSQGMHITAVGSDVADKQELDAQILGKADLVVADSIEQCTRSGEIHHAIERGVIARDQVYGELCELASGRKKGRGSDSQITVADLTGLGIQDAAIANVVMVRAIAEGVGNRIEI